MPLSRFPSLNSNPADSGKTDDRALAERREEEAQNASNAVILDPDKLPTWQRPFVLAPNVRFTRTPSQTYPAPQIRPEGPARAPHTPQMLAPNADAAAVPSIRDTTAGPAAELRAAPSPASDLQRRIARALSEEPATVSAAPQPPAPSRRAVDFLSHPLDRTEITHAATETADAPEPEQVSKATATEAPSAFGFISDALVWEMMGLGILDEATPVATTAPAAADAIAAETAAAQSVDDVPADAEDDTQADDGLESPSPVALYRQITPRLLPEQSPDTEAQMADTDDVAADPIASDDQTEMDAETDGDAEAESTMTAAHDAETASDTVAEAEPIDIPVPVPARRLALKHRDRSTEDYLFPSIDLLQSPRPNPAAEMSQEHLEQSAGLLENILEDFGVKGEIIDVRPGPVVTLYEFEPAPGVKSSRVINLSDDIARSMSALSARVAVIPGRNVIGIELPNEERETVYLRELFESRSYVGTDFRLPLCLGKTIGGEPVVAELAKMPHLLVAGTTGSGKSVAINTMILSLIYHLRPDECRLIMVDPKMLELSVYDGIPHLLTPVVTDPKKAVLALKWAVREMEERYRKMSRLGVRNIDGFNERVAEARAKGETIMLSVPSGFDKSTGEQTFEEQELDLTALPFIVVIVDEMADLMMVAGKEIEGTIQRLAQMARAAGIHLIMATQRPSVDVITGTIKANFPTRISFQVTTKIDSRTILGEQGAEYLLGQGDMLHMKGGGRISRVHGPFVSDNEVEKIVAHLKTQGSPSYLGSVTTDEEDSGDAEDDTAVFDNTDMGSGSDDGDDLYERAIKIVQRDKKCSTSYIQRRLSIGYNRAASLVERMEQDGLVGPANHVGKREILEPGN
ncbi:DNA translocase FtsK [Martelella sp. HB161492]|uniref:DNA translocase FtsK n=1 Tax=Martelella sp. HB161492 TaxID=2720726 RepID=UPI0015923041|nr:DNA translocase FtsK [Martelella sp. HB161492]